MKAAELIKALEQVPPDYEILVWNSVTEKYESPDLQVKHAIELVLVDATA